MCLPLVAAAQDAVAPAPEKLRFDAVSTRRLVADRLACRRRPGVSRRLYDARLRFLPGYAAMSRGALI